MADTKERLTRCFAAVFPSLNGNQILDATASTVQGRDSVASVTLFAMIEEEFRFELDLHDLAELTSFAKILDYLSKRIPAA